MAKSAQVLPPTDDTSEDTLSELVWRNPNPLSGPERRARADRIASQMPPQRTDSLDLIREDRNR